MIDINYQEQLLIWGVYGMSVFLALGLGYFAGLLKKEEDKNLLKGGSK